MLRRTLLLSVAAMALWGCSSASPVEAEPGPAPPAPRLPLTSDDFDVALYRQIAAQPGNQFVSPYSASAAFALLYPGARGETAREMTSVFGFDGDQAGATQAARAKADAIRNQTGGSELSIANAAWVERTMQLDPDYARSVGEGLGGTIEALDFIQQPAESLRTINAWAARNTHDRIQQILNTPDPSRRLVLTNAVYFKGNWTSQFSANNTHDGPFHPASGADVTAHLMHQTQYARYFEEASFQAAEFDYDQGAFALAVFLPRDRTGLSAFENALTGATLRRHLQRLASAETARLAVTLPKVEMNASYDLIPPLANIGLHQTFSAGDFSGVTHAETLGISAVVQKTFLAIDEEGTEAAAVTAIDMIATASRIPPPAPPIPFVADHPYFIVLHHKPSSTLLFLGRVATTAA